MRKKVVAIVAILLSALTLAVWYGYIRYPQKVTFTISKTVFEPDEKIEIKLSEPILPFGRQEFFLNIGHDYLPDYSSELKIFLKENARSATLNAPKIPGGYNILLGVRVYGRYYRFMHSEHIFVSGGPGERIPAEEPVEKDLLVRFTLDNNVIHENEYFHLHFSEPLHPRDGENYQVTVAPLLAPDDEVWALQTQPRDGTEDFVAHITHLPGRYEVRLIARYYHNAVVIDRKPVIIAPRDFDIDGTKLDVSPEANLKPTFRLKENVITNLDKPHLIFSEPLIPAGWRGYYISIIPYGVKDYFPREDVESFATEYIHPWKLSPGKYQVILITRWNGEDWGNEKNRKSLHTETLTVVQAGPDRAEDTGE